MTENAGSTVRRRRLARELKRLREQAGLTVEAAADKLDFGRNTIYRYESGHSGVRVGYVRLMLDLYGADPEQRDALVTIARQSKQKGWWIAYESVMREDFQFYVELECEAASLRAYDAHVVHGLLQTTDYAHALMSGVRPDDTDEHVAQLVAMRMDRQAALARDDAPLRLWTILDEAVLRRPVGSPKVMREQLRHLVRVGRKSNVTIQVLPYDNGAHAGMNGAFAVIEFPGRSDPDVGYAEGPFGNTYAEEEDDVRRATLLFDHLRAAALPPGRSAAFLAAVASDMA